MLLSFPQNTHLQYSIDIKPETSLCLADNIFSSCEDSKRKNINLIFFNVRRDKTSDFCNLEFFMFYVNEFHSMLSTSEEIKIQPIITTVSKWWRKDLFVSQLKTLNGVTPCPEAKGTEVTPHNRRGQHVVSAGSVQTDWLLPKLFTLGPIKKRKSPVKTCWLSNNSKPSFAT